MLKWIASTVLASILATTPAAAAVIVLQVSGTLTRTGLAGSGFNATEAITGTVQFDTTSTAYQTGPYGSGSYAYYRPIGGSFVIHGLTYGFNSNGAISVINSSSDSISFFQSNPTGPATGGYTPSYLALSFDGANIVPNTGLPQTATPFTAASSRYFQLWFNGGYTQGLTGSVSVMSVVPEPATWLLMLTGFGLVGGAIRRRPRAGGARI